MRLTKWGHSCIRLDGPGGRIVIDPGCLTEARATEAADAILLTHEHADHFLEARVRAAAAANPRLQVWTNASVAGLLTGLDRQVHVVGHGDAFTAAGFEVQAHGTLHAQVHRDIPLIANTGFLIDGRLFHPGDALTIPDQPVSTLMLPVHAPWLRIADLIDWSREMAPRRAFAAHDGFLNSVGVAFVGGLLGENGPGINTSYRWLAPMEQVDDL